MRKRTPFRCTVCGDLIYDTPAAFQHYDHPVCLECEASHEDTMADFIDEEEEFDLFADDDE